MDTQWYVLGYFPHYGSDLISLHSAIITNDRQTHTERKRPIEVVSATNCSNCIDTSRIFWNFHEVWCRKASFYAALLFMGGTLSRDFGFTCDSIIYASWFARFMRSCRECHQPSVRIHFIPTHRNLFHLARYYFNKMPISNEVFHEHLMEYAGNVFNGIWFRCLLSQHIIVCCDMMCIVYTECSAHHLGFW